MIMYMRLFTIEACAVKLCSYVNAYMLLIDKCWMMLYLYSSYINSEKTIESIADDFDFIT